jgi:putative endonuclease
MKDNFIYAIKSIKDGRIYVGMSQNTERRLLEHNNGEVFSTKGFRPWILIFFENAGTSRAYARSREKYWKSGCGKEKLKKEYSGVAQR